MASRPTIFLSSLTLTIRPTRKTRAWEVDLDWQLSSVSSQPTAVRLPSRASQGREAGSRSACLSVFRALRRSLSPQSELKLRGTLRKREPEEWLIFALFRHHLWVSSPVGVALPRATDSARGRSDRTRSSGNLGPHLTQQMQLRAFQVF